VRRPPISDQDDSGPWLRKTFPGLFYITSPGVGAGGAYHHSTWSGISGDRFSGRFGGADFSIVDNPWLDVNIRHKGPLGAPLKIEKFDQVKAWFVAPSRGVWRQGSLHVILAVTDHGTPRLTRYRRVIVNVVP